jgi:hypothetical protein
MAIWGVIHGLRENWWHRTRICTPGSNA